MGSKEVEGLGRTELLSREAEDCSGWVSKPAGWPADADAVLRGSKSPLVLDSAAEMPHSGRNNRHTEACHRPPALKQAAAAQTEPSLATPAKHKRLHRKKASRFHPEKTPRSCWRAALVVPDQEHALAAINMSQVVSYTGRSAVREGSYYLPAQG